MYLCTCADGEFKVHGFIIYIICCDMKGHKNVYYFMEIMICPSQCTEGYEYDRVREQCRGEVITHLCSFSWLMSLIVCIFHLFLANSNYFSTENVISTDFLSSLCQTSMSVPC